MGRATHATRASTAVRYIYTRTVPVFPVRSSVPLTRDISSQYTLTVKARMAWSPVRALFLEFPYERESCGWPSVHARKGRFGHSRANTERLLLFGRVHRLPCMGALPLKNPTPFFHRVRAPNCFPSQSPKGHLV